MNYSDEPINFRQSALSERYFESRPNLEKEYQDKLAYAKELYEQRVSHLNQQIQRYLEEVNNDDIYKAMRESSLSNDFAFQRAKELYESILGSEKELTISKLQDSLVLEKGEVLKLEYEKQKHLSLIRDYEDKLRRETLEKDRFSRQLQDIQYKSSHFDQVVSDQLKKKDIE